MRLRELRLDPKLRLEQLFAQIRGSLWLAPTISVSAALIVSIGLVTIEKHLARSRGDGTFFFDGGPDSARELLSTLATSMLTFTALVFSITILVLQLASNQFSPRVIRTFLQHRITKLALGTFVGSFVYSVAVLSQVRSAPEPFVPAIATWIALILVLASVGVFIRYIHGMTHAIRAISVIDTISVDTRDAIDRMFPERVALPPPPVAELPAGPATHEILHRGAPGVVTFVDADKLVKLARDADAVIELVPRVGDFVPHGAVLLRTWGTLPDAERCCATVALDVERTIEQDPGFGLRQLVDIAARALSPGTNDPSTATQAVDHIHDLVRRLTLRDFPATARADEDGVIRLVVNALDYGDYVRLAFEEIRNYGASHVQVRDRLERALRDCAAIANPDRRAVLEAELRRLVGEARSSERRRAAG